MSKVCVVTRHLKPNRPAVLAVIPDPEDPNIDNLDSYFEDAAKDRIRRFKDEMVEFADADFYIDIVRLG